MEQRWDLERGPERGICILTGFFPQILKGVKVVSYNDGRKIIYEFVSVLII